MLNIELFLAAQAAGSMCLNMTRTESDISDTGPAGIRLILVPGRSICASLILLKSLKQTSAPSLEMI